MTAGRAALRRGESLLLAVLRLQPLSSVCLARPRGVAPDPAASAASRRVAADEGFAVGARRGGAAVSDASVAIPAVTVEPVRMYARLPSIGGCLRQAILRSQASV